MTGCKTASNADVAEALYKLLKISGSITNLLLGGTQILPKLTKDFFVALGESKTIETLKHDFDSAYELKANVSSSIAQMLARSVAYNKYKNGSLKSLSLMRCFWGNFDQFLVNLYISDYDHELIYGDAKVANEMEKGQLE